MPTKQTEICIYKGFEVSNGMCVLTFPFLFLVVEVRKHSHILDSYDYNEVGIDSILIMPNLKTKILLVSTSDLT